MSQSPAASERAIAPAAGLGSLLEAQRAAFAAEGAVTAATRADRLTRCIDLLVSHEKDLCAAVSSDFGQRPAAVTRVMDILPAVLALKHARRELHRWMRPERRSLKLPLRMPGARARIVHQPLGVVGVISPWNVPIGLTFGPLAGILGAGNRCLLKPSELTPSTSALMQRLVAEYFDPRELTVVTGGPQVAEAFSGLPFDHLLYTGSGPVGRRVMTAAAANLVPVTLELGGKCPAIVGRSANLSRAVDRILLGKLANAGQVCLAPDHVYVPREWLEEFVEKSRAWAARAYPGLPANPDYTSIVNGRHAERIADLLSDAVAKGAHVIPLGDAPDAACREHRLVTPALILKVTDDMRVMQEEIFGPLLPVRPYDRIDAVISEINQRPRALALYYFGRDGAEQRQVLERTVSGGVTLNDVAMHFLAEELPFGGIGASGMGAYHGEHGFRRFSHARAVLTQSELDLAGLAGLRPPYGQRLASILKWLLRR